MKSQIKKVKKEDNSHKLPYVKAKNGKCYSIQMIQHFETTTVGYKVTFSNGDTLNVDKESFRNIIEPHFVIVNK